MMSVILHPDRIGADSLWTLVLSVSQVQDQPVFDQAAALAVDRTATTFARAGALLVLAGQVGSTLGFYSNSTPVTPTELFTVPRETRPTCNLEPRFAPDPRVGPNPLDADAERQVLRIFDPIIVDDTEPLLLRKLADCARPIVPGVPPQVDVSGVQLTYICGRRFQITHPHPITLPFRYEVDGSSESQNFSVNPGESMLLMPAAYSDYEASLRVWRMSAFNGRTSLVAESTDGNCPPMDTNEPPTYAIDMNDRADITGDQAVLLVVSCQGDGVEL